MPATGCYNGQSINLPINDLTLEGLWGYCNIIYWMCAAAHREISRGAHLYNKVCRLSSVFCMVCVHRAFVLIFSASFLASARALLGAVERGNGNAASLIKQAPFPISKAEEFLSSGHQRVRAAVCAHASNPSLCRWSREMPPSAAARLHANHARTRECTFAFH